MAQPRLDIEALRDDERLPRAPRVAPSVERLLDHPETEGITRREALGLAGAALAGAAPALRLAGAAAYGEVGLVEGKGRATFTLGGRERWTIDTDRFGGRPRLFVQQTPGRIRVALRGATYPGTRLCADLVCEATLGLTGWRMRLRLALGGFHTSFALEPWLAGARSAYAPIQLGGLTAVARLGALRLDLREGRDASASFSPAWVLRLEGPAIARLRGKGTDIRADALSLTLPEPGAPGLLRGAGDAGATKRTLLALARGAAAWTMEPPFAPTSGWRLTATGSPFETLTVEAAEDAHGVPRQALLAESPAETSTLSFHPHTDHRGFTLPLRAVRYAAVFTAGPRPVQQTLLARVGHTPAWLHRPGHAVLLGDLAGPPPLEIHGRAGRATRLRFTPALLSHAVALPDAQVVPSTLPEGARFAFVWGAGVAVPRGTLGHHILTHRSASAGGKRLASGAPAPAVDYIQDDTYSVPDTSAPETTQVLNGKTTGSLTVVDMPEVHDQPHDIQNYPLTIDIVRPDDLAVLTLRLCDIAELDDSTDSFIPVIKIDSFGNKYADPTLSVHNRTLYKRHYFRNVSNLRLEYTYPIIQPGTGSGPVNKPIYSTQPSGLTLVRTDPSKPAYLILDLPPQHLGEEAFFEAATPLQDPKNETTNELPLPDSTPPKENYGGADTLTAQSRSAGPSRLVFEVPHDIAAAGINFTLADILDVCGQSGLGETPVTLPAAPTREHPNGQSLTTRDAATLPPSIVSSIEAPYRLSLALSQPDLGWSHATTPTAAAGYTGLWHTRLSRRYFSSSGNQGLKGNPGVSGKIVDTPGGTLRAVSAGDDPAGPSVTKALLMDDTGLQTSLTPYQRAAISDLSVNHSPLRADYLMLSALGAWMDIQGSWDDVQGAGVKAWRHRMSMGRDTYVRVVESGYLYPFGHRASLVIVSERKLKYAPTNASGLLMQREYLVVRQPEVDYTALKDMPSHGRNLPFDAVRLTTLGTPNIDPLGSGIPGDRWIRVGGKPFLFHAVARDKAGQEVDFLTALAFLRPDATGKTTVDASGSADGVYKDGAVLLALSGQSVAYAESMVPGDTMLETQQMRIGFDTDPGASDPTADPPFYPALVDADVSVPAIKRLIGNDRTVNIVYYKDYKASGLSGQAQSGAAVPGIAGGVAGLGLASAPVDASAPDAVSPAPATHDVFAQLTKIFPLSFGPTDKSGGISTLSQNIGGLSRSRGPIGVSMDAGAAASQDIATNLKITLTDFDPTKLFPADAKLLGGISLKDILDITGGSDNAPKLTTTLDKATATTRTTFSLTPKLKQDRDKGSPFIPYTTDDTGNKVATATLSITATVVASPTQQSYKINGTLTNFGIELGSDSPGGVLINFKQMMFLIDNGKKPNFSVDVGAITFLGALSFVNVLESFLGRFKDPPYVDLQPDHIETGFTLAIPTLPLGPVVLSNLALSAAVVIPFTGEPVLFRGAVSNRDHPFIITYEALGGGGFFALELGAHGITHMEAALEFGGNFALDLGVASGGVYVLVGIYYSRDTGTDDQGNATNTISLSAFYRTGGSVGVLGIATVSIDFNLSLTYTTDPDRNSLLVGEATLTIEISVAFFHKSIDLTVRRTLNDPPPTFDQVLSLGDWTTYSNAFA